MTSGEYDILRVMLRWHSKPPGFYISVYYGCTCPIELNCNGFGILRMGRDWWIDPKCKMHRDDLKATDTIAWEGDTRY